jgi:hypothetical protein
MSLLINKLVLLNEKIKEHEIELNTPQANAVGNMYKFIAEDVSINEALDEVVENVSVFADDDSSLFLKKMFDGIKKDIEKSKDLTGKVQLKLHSLNAERKELIALIMAEYDYEGLDIRICDKNTFVKIHKVIEELTTLPVKEDGVFAECLKLSSANGWGKQDYLIVHAKDEDLVRFLKKKVKYLKSSSSKIDYHFPKIGKADKMLSVIYKNGRIFDLEELTKEDII